MLTNMEHKIKNTLRFLSHTKHTNLQWWKKKFKTPTLRNVTKKPKPKIKPTKWNIESNDDESNLVIFANSKNKLRSN